MFLRPLSRKRFVAHIKTIKANHAWLDFAKRLNEGGHALPTLHYDLAKVARWLKYKTQSKRTCDKDSSERPHKHNGEFKIL